MCVCARARACAYMCVNVREHVGECARTCVCVCVCVSVRGRRYAFVFEYVCACVHFIIHALYFCLSQTFVHGTLGRFPQTKSATQVFVAVFV